MKRYTKQHVTWTLCLLFVAVSVSGSSGGVLCIGADGHTEVETACLPCCDEDLKTCDTEPSDRHHEEHEDCSNCADVPLSDFTWSRGRSIRNVCGADVAGVMALVSTSVPTAYTMCCPTEKMLRHMPAAQPFFKPLAFTVLLI